jgi:hypothetical protein
MGRTNVTSTFGLGDAVEDAEGYNIAMSLRANPSLNISTALKNNLR